MHRISWHDISTASWAYPLDAYGLSPVLGFASPGILKHFQVRTLFQRFSTGIRLERLRQV